MKVVLVGFMGSGKSTVGKLLSKRLNLSFFDLDDEIVKIVKMPIPELFSKFGEQKFRKIERKTLIKLLLKTENFILSTGGGTPAYEDNMEKINKFALSVYLKADFNNLWERISEDTNRPLVASGRENVRKLFQNRNLFYDKANISVRTDVQTVEETVEEIVRKLRTF